MTESGSNTKSPRPRPIVYLAAVVALLRLIFSQRARTDLCNAGHKLDAAVSEVSARLARMDAEAVGGRVPLRLVSGTSACSNSIGTETADPDSERSEL